MTARSHSRLRKRRAGKRWLDKRAVGGRVKARSRRGR